VVTHGSDAPPIIDNACLQKVKDPNHLLFMEEQRDDKIRQGHFSSAFSMLMPEMTSILLWVVPKPYLDKWHLVVDHSAGDYLPNSFIPPDNTCVHLDNLYILEEALLKVRECHGDVQLVLFKTDVSQVYCQLSVHLLWQLCQVVKIRDSYHVDNNNNFGNRGAGQLWITIFGLVLWIATVIVHILDLFAYVDDTFSWEFADCFSYYPT
jgi:hypothetical protein